MSSPHLNNGPFHFYYKKEGEEKEMRHRKIRKKERKKDDRGNIEIGVSARK